MLAERIEGWFDEAEQRGIRKGLDQGLQQGETTALRRLLCRRFGELTPELDGRIDSATLAQIETWFDRAIDAHSLDDVFRSS